MVTLREKIKEFIRMNPPPQGWKEGLSACLSLPEEVRGGIPLITIFDVGKDEMKVVLLLKASEVCSELNLNKRLQQSLKQMLMDRNLSNVPQSWNMQFKRFYEKESFVGASS